MRRNKAILKLAAEVPHCMACQEDNDGTVIAAHCNSQRMGKGMGLKSIDLPAYMCSSCHGIYDGAIKSKFSKDQLERIWLDAFAMSMKWIIDSGNEAVLTKWKDA